MKRTLRNWAYRAFGEVRARRLLSRLQGRKPAFSEADLILEHFDARPGAGVMVDVGAHFGESLEPYLRRGWDVLAFEPDPSNRAELARHVDISRIRLFPCALSDRESEGASFYASDESSGISSLSAFRDSHKEVTTVAVRTLKDVLAEERVEKVDFLKIDTEGHDLFVLRGFPFDRIRPEVVVCEFEDAKTVPLGYKHAELGDFLASHGYRVFLSEWHPITAYGCTHRWLAWGEYPRTLRNPDGWGNFVALAGSNWGPSVEGYLARFVK